MKVEILYSNKNESKEDIRWTIEIAAALNDTTLKSTLKNTNIESHINEKVILKISHEIIQAFWHLLRQTNRRKNINLVLLHLSTDQIQIQVVEDLQQGHHTLQSICEILKIKFL